MFKVNILPQNVLLELMTVFGKKECSLELRASDGKDRPVKPEHRAVFLSGRTLVYVPTQRS